MKRKILIATIVLAGILATPSCKKEVGNLNSPTVEDFLENANKSELSNLVTGTESGMRNNIAMYLDVVGMIGREMYRFSGAEPRYTTELLGYGDAVLDNNTFYLTNPWASRYRVVKNCNLLIQATNISTLITDEERKGFLGFARTFKAYQLLLNLNLTWTNGIRVDVIDPANPGPVLSYPDALAEISELLDSAKADLTGATIAFPLTSGFGDFRDAAGLIKVNRAIAARVYAYRSLWPEVLTALNESFFENLGNLNTGVNLVFSTASGDQLNQAFFPQDQAGEVRLAHPDYIPDLDPADDRAAKATLRSSIASTNELASDRDVWVYTSSIAPMPVIRNEELILLYAEAKVQTNSIPDAIVAIDRIRSSHNLTPYAGAVTAAALTDEILDQRRYSLFFEGHRWVDMRRYDKLDELPIDRPGDDVWDKFPLPLTDDF